jgi:polyhydroxyalkanoate synthesis repressor PhaR
MIVIKRYRNRRLYHTGLKSFIVLSDLEAMVRRDEQFMVLDTASGKDITLSVLTGVLNDRVHSWKDVADSTEVLRAVIKIGGRKSMSILKNTVLAGIGFASLTKQKAEELIESLIKTGELSKSEKKEAVLELLSKAETTAKDAKGKISKELEKGMKNLSMARKTDIDALSKKIDKLTRALSEMEKKLDK